MPRPERHWSDLRPRSVPAWPEGLRRTQGTLDGKSDVEGGFYGSIEMPEEPETPPPDIQRSERWSARKALEVALAQARAAGDQAEVQKIEGLLAKMRKSRKKE
jgi:hypothetical protein